MAKKSRKPKDPKPYVHTSIQCPKCRASLEVKVIKEVVTPSVPAEVRFKTEVQQLLIGGSGGKDKGEVNPSEKKPKKKSKKK